MLLLAAGADVPYCGTVSGTAHSCLKLHRMTIAGDAELLLHQLTHCHHYAMATE